jgi:hypothetical protein
MVDEEPIAALDVHQSLRGWADWRDKHRNSPNKVNSPLKPRVFTMAFNDYCLHSIFQLSLKLTFKWTPPAAPSFKLSRANSLNTHRNSTT